MPPIANEYLNNKHPVNHDWKEYYIILEAIRQSGITNMWGAHPYLAEAAGIDRELAKKVLCSWIENYSELKELYWPNSKIYLNTKED